MSVPHRRLRRVLIANRGEIVGRVARSARARGISPVGVYTTGDRRAAHLDALDHAANLGPDGAPSPYLGIDGIIRAAKLLGADAIHPGYGFLSENPDFAWACEENGMVWVGPPPRAMRLMSAKVEAKSVAAAAGVPVLRSLVLGSATREEIISLGFPMLIKPSAGGGGKGMLRVYAEGDLDEAIAQARREAETHFGDATLFAERLVEGGRHVEVQVIADQHGAVLHLGTRDCSIQRRHQKIIEEAPAPNLTERLRDQLALSATSLAREIGYVGAGTVEFLVFEEEFAFLEMNTRLQVEHPVTEEVTGTDLVALQLDVAEGRPLSFTQDQVMVSGHAMSARIYAEDPSADYLPAPGQVNRLELPDLAGVRWDFGVRTGSEVSSRFDPMIGKAISWGRDRAEAIHTLDVALEGLVVDGVKTNRGLLRAVLGDDDFRGERVATDFLESRPQLAAGPALPAEADVLHLVAAAIHLAARDLQDGADAFAPFAWRNVTSQKQLFRVAEHDEVRTVVLAQRRDLLWDATVETTDLVVDVLESEDGFLDLEAEGVRTRVWIRRSGGELVVTSPTGESRFADLGDPQAGAAAHPHGALVAPVPGVVTRVLVEGGSSVAAGETLVVIEAMKMEHRMLSPEAGRVTAVLVEVGDSVDYQQTLVEVTAEESP